MNSNESSEVKLLKNKELRHEADLISMDIKNGFGLNNEVDLFGDKKWVEKLLKRAGSYDVKAILRIWLMLQHSDSQYCFLC